MTKYEYKLLEELLDKLATEIGNKICIIPGYIQDGYHISNYSSKTGLPIKSATASTLEGAVIELNKQA